MLLLLVQVSATEREQTMKSWALADVRFNTVFQVVSVRVTDSSQVCENLPKKAIMG